MCSGPLESLEEGGPEALMPWDFSLLQRSAQQTSRTVGKHVWQRDVHTGG